MKLTFVSNLIVESNRFCRYYISRQYTNQHKRDLASSLYILERISNSLPLHCRKLHKLLNFIDDNQLNRIGVVASFTTASPRAISNEGRRVPFLPDFPSKSTKPRARVLFIYAAWHSGAKNRLFCSKLNLAESREQLLIKAVFPPSPTQLTRKTPVHRREH